MFDFMLVGYLSSTAQTHYVSLSTAQTHYVSMSARLCSKDQFQ
jgi:hypothetical protein